MLVTGRTVAGGRATLEAFVEWLRPTHPMVADSLSLTEQDGVWTLTGRWTPSAWVDHLTRYFTEGRTRCLVGTRALLGEGWDAPCVTALVDLTTVTTATSVVQTRGRALRTDPADPTKVALVWTVVCVHEGHVAGANDWHRFVRKHHGYFTVDERGQVVDGVAGVDSAFSDFHPPAGTDFGAIDARMLVRAQDRDAVREQWRSRGPGHDVVSHVLRVRGAADEVSTAPFLARDEPRTGTDWLTPWREQAERRPAPGSRPCPSSSAWCWPRPSSCWRSPPRSRPCWRCCWSGPGPRPAWPSGAGRRCAARASTGSGSAWSRPPSPTGCTPPVAPRPAPRRCT